MSTSIEQRVVQMRFDNKQFESGVAQSMSTLDKLKAKLNFKGATQGFEDIQRAADKVNLQTIGDQADKVGIKFDALAVVAVTALQRMTNAAINAGTSMVKGLSIDQVTAGWTKYEQKTGSVQTIMNATGKSIDEVNKYLDKLMWFSDETSYGFNDMTAAIGQLTSAGGDIDKLVPMVMGIANATAFAGKGVNEFSRSIYNLNQSYSAGYLQYMDWKSLELAGVASKQLKEVFIGTAEELGKVNKGAITLSNFGETLKNKWADTEVMEKAFGKFGEMTEKAYEMVNSGMVETASEAYEILSQTYSGFSITAAKAAQEAKSFGEAVDATKDAVSSGWMKTFEIIFGNYEEAKKLWTDLANTMWDIFASGADARNEMLESWKLMGGRASLLKGITRLWEALSSVLETVKSAFRDIFPPMTAKQLYDLTNQFSDFMAELQLSPEALNTLRVAFKALLLPIKAVVTVLEIAGYWMVQFGKKALNFGDTLLSIPSKVKPFESSLKKLFGDDRYERVAAALNTIVEKLGDAFSSLGNKISSSISAAKGFSEGKLGLAFSKLSEVLKPIGEKILDRIVEGFEKLANFDYSKISDWAISAVDSLVIGFGLITSGCTTAIRAIRDFFASFKDSSAIEIITRIVDGVASLKTNMMTFIKSLGFAQIMSSLRTEATGVTEVIGKLGEAVQEMVSRLTPAKILVFSFGVSLVWVFTNLAKAIESFQKIATGVTGVLTGISGVLKAMQQRLKGSKILQIAVAIGVLSVSLGALSQIDPDRLKASAIALGSLMLMLGVLVAGMAAVNKFLVGSEQMAQNLLKVTTAMIMIAGAVAAMAGALMLLSKVDMEGMWSRLTVLVVVMASVAGASILISKFAPEMSKGAIFLLAYALAIDVVIGALEKLAKADISGIEANAVALVGVMAVLALLSSAGSNLKFSSAAGMTVMILNVLLFLKVLEKISQIDVATLGQGIVVVGLAMALMALIQRLTSVVAGKDNKLLQPSMLTMAAGILVLGLAIRMIGELPMDVVIQGGVVIGAILLLFGYISALTKISWKNSKAASPAFLAMGASILLLAVAINYLGKLDLGVVAQGGVVVAAILILFAKLTKVAGAAKGATGSIGMMAVALGMITASLMLLTLVPFGEVMGAALALGTALVALGAAMHLMNGMDIKTAFGSIAMLTSVVLALHWMLDELGGMDPAYILTVAGSISLIMGALGGAMALMQATSKGADFKNIRGTIEIMGVFLAGAAVMIMILTALPITDGLLEKAGSLSLILVSLGASMRLFRVTTGTKDNIKKSTDTIRTMLIFAGAAIVALSFIPITDGLLEKSIALSTILLALSGAAFILGKAGPQLVTVGKFAGDAVKGIGAIAIMLTAMAGLVLLAGWAFSQVVEIDPLLDAAEHGLSRIGMIIGEFVGNIIGGIGVGITDGFPKIAQNLADFAENVKPFLELEVNSSVVSSIGSLVSVIGMLSGASFVDGIATILTLGQGGLGAFGAKLEEFAPHFKSFCDQVQDIKPGPVNAAARAMEGIGAMLDAIPTEGGILEFFTGSKSLKSFGEGLQEFAPGFVGYCNAIADAASISAAVGTTKNVATCVKTLADSIPTSGGLLQSFFGEKDMSKFGGQLVDFANGLQDFFKIITGQAPNSVEVDLDVVKNCANVSKLLADFAKTIPSAGGALQDFFGEKDVGVFGTQLKTFASGLMGFFATIDQEKISDDAVDQAIKIGGAFRDFAATLPADNGFIQQFTGSRGLDEFGQDVKNYGQALLEFFDSFGQAKIKESDLSLAKSAGLAFAEILNQIPKSEGVGKLFDNMDSANFRDAIKNIGVGLFNYYNQVRQISFETIHESVEALKDVLSLNDFMNGFSEHSGDLSKYLSDLANSGIKGFIDAFDDVGDRFSNAITTAINTAFTQASTNLDLYSETYDVLIDALVAGINSNINEILVKAKEICLQFVDSIEEEWQNLESGGAFIVKSLIQGMNENQSKLTDKTKKMIEAVLKTLKTSLGIRGQYSEKFVEAGESCVQGLMKGFEKNRSVLLARVRTLGNDILETFDETVGHHSPWTTMEDRGENADLGLIEGIKNKGSEVLSTASNLGENLLEKFSDTLDIQNGVSLEGMDLGNFLDVGIGAGIESSDYAYSAAATKADGIINIFKDRFQNISDAMSVLDKEFELWATKNPVSSYSDGVNTYSFGQGAYTQKQFELLQTKLQLQAEQVNIANASYQANLAKFGEGATATREAYATYLDAQLSMAQMTQSMQQMQVANQENFKNYASMLGEVYNDLREAGFSDEEIKKSVSDQTGWVNMNAAAQGTIDDMMTVYTQQATNVQELVAEAMSSMTTTAQTSGKQAGATSMQSFSQGAQEAAPEAAQSLGGTIKSVVQQATDEGSKGFEGSWANIFEGGVNAATDGLGTLKETLTNGGSSIQDAWNNLWKTHSPSKWMYDSGTNIIQGLADGLLASEPVSINAATQVATNTLSVFIDYSQKYPEVGVNMMEGLANGIYAGESTVIAAATEVATAALAAATSALGIHSPSREFYRIGEMIDQGLSNGILDDYSIVDGSISKIVNRMKQVSKDDLVMRAVVEVDDSELDKDRSGPWTTLVWDANGNLIPSRQGFNQLDENSMARLFERGGYALTVDEKSYWQFQKYFDDLNIRDDDYQEASAGMKAAYDRIQEIAKEISKGGANSTKYQSYDATTGERTTSGAPVVVNQTFNSPTALNNAQIQRDTKTGLANFSNEVDNAMSK